LLEIVIPPSVEFLASQCFYECELLSSVIFESRSRLSRIEWGAFMGTGLVEIVIPASVETLGRECFSDCESLSSVTFESGSRLRGNQKDVLTEAGWFGRTEVEND
jgi:hypothetical protein